MKPPKIHCGIHIFLKFPNEKKNNSTNVFHLPTCYHEYKHEILDFDVK